jgi:cytoskeleton protein RodZ
MKDESKQNSGDDEGSRSDQGHNAEASLREAREALGLNVDEVAHELHLSREVVLALEAGDFEMLGAPVFVRGHLRSYARLVGLSEDKVIAGFQVYEPEPEEFRTLSTHSIVKPGASLPNFVLWGLLVFVLLIGAGYLLLGDEEAAGDLPDVGSQSDVFAEPRLIEDEDAPADVIEDELELAPASGDVETESLAVAPVEKAARRSPAPDRSAFRVKTPVNTEEKLAVEVEKAPMVRAATPVVDEPVVVEEPTASLTLRFSEECWIEVSDSKRRLLYGLEKADTEVVLQGSPPFKLFIGNVEAVDVEVEGSSYTIPASGLRGNNTARFSIAKDKFR